MRPPSLPFFLACGLSLALPSPAQSASPEPTPRTTHPLEWTKLPQLPDAEGFAGTFAGVSGDALLVAGGANIIGDRWSNPLQKKWYDRVFVLEKTTGAWHEGGKLPRPLGYGTSITLQDALICIGGSDSSRHFADVFRLRWKHGRILKDELPSLPRTCANACGASIGQTIYVAGGLENPNSNSTLRTFWALDLNEAAPSWHQLEPWPGPARMFAVAAGHGGSFYLLSGCDLATAKDGSVVRNFLSDAYCFTPGKGWRRLADLPRPAVAAPSPAPVLGESEFLILSGDDGTQVDFSPIQDHPGFPRDVLAYNTSTNLWRTAGSLPFSRATTPTVVWNNRTVIPNGEVRPRVRTPEVWVMEPKKIK
ncbi:MAG: N-acetylneuraminic acid mutarotase [Verrucomicrobia bacterium]|nr:MAG: N-acetylneuraminic acid mutarotase [Verrucomicrobiota bacterium]